MDQLDFIMAVEQDGFDPDNEDHVEQLQQMHDSRLAYQLQGFWGRLATRAIEAGIIKAHHETSH